MMDEDAGYWCSVGEHEYQEVVYLEVKLKAVRRVSDIIVSWAESPGQFGIDIKREPGDEEWREIRDFRDTVEKKT